MRKIALVLILIFGIANSAFAAEFLVKYTQNYAWKNSKQVITVSENGNYEYKLLNYDNNKVMMQFSDKLSKEALDELVKFIVEENDFFSLPQDLTEKECCDASDEYVEVSFKEKYHKSGGNCCQNINFRNVVQKLFSYQQLKVNSKAD